MSYKQPQFFLFHKKLAAQKMTKAQLLEKTMLLGVLSIGSLLLANDLVLLASLALTPKRGQGQWSQASSSKSQCTVLPWKRVEHLHQARWRQDPASSGEVWISWDHILEWGKVWVGDRQADRCSFQAGSSSGRAHLRGRVLILFVDLHSYPHRQSRTVG